jgi:hypothetical protein
VFRFSRGAPATKKMAAAAGQQAGGDDLFWSFIGEDDWAAFEEVLDADGDDDGGVAEFDSPGASFSMADIRNLASRMNCAQSPASPGNQRRRRTVSDEVKELKVSSMCLRPALLCCCSRMILWWRVQLPMGELKLNSEGGAMHYNNEGLPSIRFLSATDVLLVENIAFTERVDTGASEAKQQAKMDNLKSALLPFAQFAFFIGADMRLRGMELDLVYEALQQPLGLLSRACNLDTLKVRPH